MAILVMADPDHPVTEAHHTYWQALGRFVHRFALLEQQIHYLLCLNAQTTPPISQALFSGTRARQALSWIDRLREVAGAPEDKDFERAKAQFTIINAVRDDVIHNSAILHSEGFLISNARRTVPRQHRVTPISAKALEAMSADLQTIAATIFAMQVEQEGGLLKEYKTDWAEVGRAPWHYKPPPQADGRAKRSARPPAPSSQRKTSP